VIDHLSCRALHPHEPVVVDRKTVQAQARPVGRRCHEQVEPLDTTAGERRLVRARLDHALGGPRVDAALGELALDDLVHTRSGGVGEGRLLGDEAELDVLAHALATQPRVEHERTSQSDSGYRLCRGTTNSTRCRAPSRAPAHMQEAFAQREQTLGLPDADRVLVQAGNGARP
jgi:hypothetical protein